MTSFVPEYALLPYVLSEAVWYAALVGAGWLGLRMVRAYERRCMEPERLRLLTERVALLEVNVAQRDEERRSWAEELGGGAQRRS